jgi:hypothetical protein
MDHHQSTSPKTKDYKSCFACPPQGHQNSTSPELALGQGMLSGVSSSRSRSPPPKTEVSASPEPASGKLDKPRARLSRSLPGTAAFNAHTYPTQDCRCIGATRLWSYQASPTLIMHATTVPARCLLTLDGTYNTTRVHASPRAQTLPHPK